MLSEIKFAKIRDVKDPSRGTAVSAGIDFYIPNFNEDFAYELARENRDCVITDKVIKVPPQASVKIPSGIICKIPDGTMLMGNDKSGIATKSHLKVTAKIIDSDYSGEIGLCLTNIGCESTELEYGQKLVQFIHIQCGLAEPQMVDAEEILKAHEESERGDGGYGSTGLD